MTFVMTVLIDAALTFPFVYGALWLVHRWWFHT